MVNPLVPNPSAREVVDTVNELVEGFNSGGGGGGTGTTVEEHVLQPNPHSQYESTANKQTSYDSYSPSNSGFPSTGLMRDAIVGHSPIWQEIPPGTTSHVVGFSGELTQPRHLKFRIVSTDLVNLGVHGVPLYSREVFVRAETPTPSIFTFSTGSGGPTCDGVTDKQFTLLKETLHLIFDVNSNNWVSSIYSEQNTAPLQCIAIACSDETTALTAGIAKVTFRMPYAFTLQGVRASLTTAQTGGAIFTVDINEGISSILSTKLTIDNGEKTSTTAATPAVISDTALADDAEITIDIDQIGDGTAKGLKIYLVGRPA